MNVSDDGQSRCHYVGMAVKPAASDESFYHTLQTLTAFKAKSAYLISQRITTLITYPTATALKAITKR